MFELDQGTDRRGHRRTADGPSRVGLWIGSYGSELERWVLPLAFGVGLFLLLRLVG